MTTRDMFSLDGKVAVVTGGSIGLGKQMATSLAEMGANVVVAARKLDRCEETAAQLRTLGVNAIGISCDVGESEDCSSLIAQTVQEFGTIDILVNNAGITWGAPALKYPMNKWEQIMRVNVTGSFLCAQAAARVMIEQKKGGKIINMASIAGISGAPPEAQDAVAYNASKGAIVALTKDLAVKWARHGINVNAILPGWFVTHMTEGVLNSKAAQGYKTLIPMNRYGDDSDLKGAVVFLASDASKYVTGHLLAVDGGFTAI